MIPAFPSGFFLGASLIIAIGAQNAFILRQGLLRQHVFILCLICALADAALIALGVAGLGTLIAASPVLIKTVTVGGVIFLFAYALIAFRRAMRPTMMLARGDAQGDLKTAMAACLAFTFLNPHVYLDTVMLLGGLSSSYAGAARIAYAAGAMTASFTWFFALGYGARLLEPVFARPQSWRILDFSIGFVMALIGLSLLSRLFGGL